MGLIMSAYKTTKVNYMRTQAQIAELLSNIGISDHRFTFLNSQKQLILEFVKKEMINNEEQPISVKIVIPNIDEGNRNQLHRALFYYLKSKFESLEFGFLEFVQEFLPHLVFNNQTVYEMMKPQLQLAYQTGSIHDFNLIPDKTKKLENLKEA